LLLACDDDFAARCDPLLYSVERANTKNVAYWHKLCEVTRSDFDDLIWIAEPGRPERILYFNSGAFVWRRSSGFSHAYSSAFSDLLKSRIAQSDGSFFSADQIILNSVITKNRLRWRHMKYHDHHMVFPGTLSGAAATPSMSGSSILHYSGSLTDPYRSIFLDRLQTELPVLHDWLLSEEARVAVATNKDRGRRASQILAKGLKMIRGARWRLYALRVSRCQDEIVP
jgi:hypothetical protein